MIQQSVRAFLSLLAMGVLIATASTFQSTHASSEVAMQVIPAPDPEPPVWKKFAPLVRLHPAEQYYPTRVSFFINHSELRFSRHEGHDIPIAALGEVEAWKLGYRSFLDTYWWLGWRAWDKTRPFESDRPEQLNDRDGYFLDLGGAGDETNERQLWRGCLNSHECHPALNRVPVYYEYFSGRYISYWFFYAYNDGWGPFNHEGDWESIAIKLDGNNMPTDVAYNRHGCRAIVPWEKVRKANDAGRLDANGTHPLVFSALGTHGSYAFATPNVRHVCGAPSEVKDYLGAGPRWRTWNLMINARNASWYGYGGAWGEVGNIAETTGPLGPSFYKSAAPPEWWQREEL